MRCLEDEVMWVGDEFFLVLSGFSPKPEYDGFIFQVNGSDDFVSKSLPSLHSMRMCFAGTYGEHGVQ